MTSGLLRVVVLSSLFYVKAKSMRFMHQRLGLRDELKYFM